MVDVRGPYTLRIGVLVTMTAILAASAALGASVSQHLPLALLVTVVMTLASGLWRHLSSDYGPSLSISSLLVLFLGLAGPEGSAIAVKHAIAIAAGGGLGLLLQLAYWPIHPQHPLRRTVADSWVAAAALFSALAPAEAGKATERHDAVTQAENDLRAAIDKAALALIQVSRTRQSPIIAKLEALNLSAARLAMHVAALNTALESCMSEQSFAAVMPALQPVLTSLTNTSRTVALAIVSRQPAHLAAGEVRLRRAGSLLRVFESRLRSLPSAAACHAQLIEILKALQTRIPEISAALRNVMDRADERAAFSLELFDLDTWMLRPLSATLNFSRNVEPALIRFTLRLTVLTTAGVLAFKLWTQPHGYWLPFTTVVVLQPDYGATRQRAAQRVLGTATGSIVASVLLWIHLSPAALLVSIAVCVFIFGYTVRRHYGVAVFFVTVFVVLLIETAGPATFAVAMERLGATLAGGSLALGAAALFWPLWERERFPPFLAAALRANAAYLTILTEHLLRGAPRDDQLVAAKRESETANATVFASLKRMFGDPKNQREGVEQGAALANGNQRLTRIFNLLSLHLGSPLRVSAEELKQSSELCVRTLTALADHTSRSATIDTFRVLRGELDAIGPKLRYDLPDDAAADWLPLQFGRAATELSAMVLSAEGGMSEQPDELSRPSAAAAPS